MLKRIINRLREPSTWAGVSLATTGILAAGGNDNAGAIGQAVGQIGPTIAFEPVVGLTALAAAIAAIVMPERGGR